MEVSEEHQYESLGDLSGEELEILSSCANILAKTIGGISKDFPLSNLVRECIEKDFLSDKPIDWCQKAVYRSIEGDVRRALATYYTNEEGTHTISSMISSMDGHSGVVVADPFLGSGALLMETVRKIGPHKISKVWGVEPLPLPALVAYTGLVSLLGDPDKVEVIVGDTFHMLSKGMKLKADIIVTNPPFTRWSSIPSDYRRGLLELVESLGYEEYVVRKDPSLHVISMLMIDHMLEEGGLLGVVLPASTFYSIYGRGYKKLLLSSYRVEALIEGSESSFSEGSEFKEVVLAAVKGGSGSENETSVISLSRGEVGKVRLESLPDFLGNNWLTLFSPLRDVVTEILRRGLEAGTLTYWDEGTLIRGVEMYGPDFFFLPNKYWTLEARDKGAIIKRGSKTLFIEWDYLVPALRKPSLYRGVKVEVSTYLLSIPGKPEGDLREYVNWGVESGVAKPAIRNFGKRWYSHVYNQIKAKKPFGRVFIPDKVDVRFKRRGAFANFSQKPVSASKNFYIVKAGEDEVIAAWLNSTPFLALLHLGSRRISNRWVRFLKNDYLEFPMINTKVNGKIRDSFRRLLGEVPPIRDQIGWEIRRDLDEAIMAEIGAEDLLDDLYSSMKVVLS